MDSFFGKVALFLQLHNASNNSYLSDHPQGSSGVVPMKDIKQLLLEFVLLIQAGNIFSVQIYNTHMHTHTCVYICICVCVYIYIYILLVCATRHC